MKTTSTSPRYLLQWDFSRQQRLLRDVVTCSHRLAELSTFSDDGLIEILQHYPRSAIRITSMGKNPSHPSELQVGEMGDCSGSDLFQMIQRGQLCVTLQNVNEHHRRLNGVVRRLSQEMMECQIRLWTDSHSGDLVIASPETQNYLSCDNEPSVFWQIRGSRVVSTYPRQSPYLSTAMLENRIACASETPLYFEPAFDDHCESIQLGETGALALPLHTPYRIVSGSSLSVALVTRYRTKQSRLINQLHLGNRLLRSFGVEPFELPRDSDDAVPARATDRIRVASKCLLAKLTRTNNVTHAEANPRFLIEPDSPQCGGSSYQPMIESQDDCPLYPSLPWETLPTVTTVSEI